MKAKWIKWLQFVGKIVPFFIGLIEKLALGLIKRWTSVAGWARNRLDRVKNAYENSAQFLQEICIDEGE